ncbi:hypothetical protein BC351_34270 [Paenibacillus ferrarius]|uniref:Uncharacterized protein n=1 Tax=Paenibacillus ferrarius TaxID=1469647 RepID=A0A1V4HDV7_9BACL|nr:hypothetical protein BC351_34270 [Paenibacillus ferrarius]
MAQIASPTDAQRMKVIVKYWIQQDPTASIFKETTLSILQLAKAVINDTNIIPRGSNRIANGNILAYAPQANDITLYNYTIQQEFTLPRGSYTCT